MNFCVVGPIYPFRGGIAQHTTLLCRHLAEKHAVESVSFKRLYPSILFPGKTQMDSSTNISAPDSARIIDSINPLSWIEAGDHIRDMRPDCVLVQWWHPFFAPCIASTLSRARPAKTVFICHNVIPHEGHSITKPLSLWALKKGDAFIVHAGEEKEALEKLIPGRPVERSFLPEFSVFPKRGMTKQEAKTALKLDGKTILFFGLVRKYKGLMDLIQAMAMLKDTGITCMIVGEFYDQKEKYLAEIEKHGLNGAFRIVDSYVPNEEVEQYFAAADAVVLPYISATQSAVVQVAHIFERPAIATAVGGIPEAVDNGRTGLIVPPQNPKALAGAIRRYYSEDMESRFVQSIQSDHGRFSWDRVIQTIESLGASI